MTSTERIKDFTAFAEQPYAGMIVPEMFNDDGDDGSGYPGLQRAVFNRMTWWLHSGNMDSGLHVAGYDITGVNLLYVDNVTGEVDHYGDWSGDASFEMSGYDIVSARTGLFTQLGGASDINMQDNLIFGDTYHVQGANQITGIRANFTTDITGVSALITTANITNANITNATQNISFGGTYHLQGVNQFTGSYITGEMTGSFQLTEAPIGDNDASTKIYVDNMATHGTGSDDLIFSNDTQRSTAAIGPTKLKEITGYRKGVMRIYWEHKRDGVASSWVYSQIYVNDIAVGGEYGDQSDTYIARSGDISVDPEDIISIYSRRAGTSTVVYVQNMRVKYAEFIITAGY